MNNQPGHRAFPFIPVFFLFACLQTQAALWITNAPIPAPRENHTATLLQNGKVLVAGGVSNGVYLASALLFDPNTGTWTNTGSMLTGRAYHTATLLPNGQVLVAGGYNGANISQAELYDPTLGTWTNTGVAQVPRYEHTATLLLDGRVLVTGGVGTIFGALDKTNSTEIYDPTSGSWSPSGPLNTARAWHTATLLPNGQVLAVAGEGINGRPTADAEIYDPTNAIWTEINPLAQARRYHTATLLRTGQVLVTGGEMVNNPFAISSAELFDPASGRWTTANPMATAHARHTATLLPDGRVLVTAGETFNFGVTNGVELYNPSTGIWSNAPSLGSARYWHDATLLANGKVLLTGGVNNNGFVSTTELYDATIFPTTGSWTNTGPLQNSRRSFTMTMLPDGTLLAAGGEDGHGNFRSSAEIYDSVIGLWTNTGPLNVGRYHHSATLLPNGKVLVAGGVGSAPALASAELYTPTTGTWALTGSMNSPRLAHTATLLHNGKVLVAGMSQGAGSAELYDWHTETWAITGGMITPRTFHLAVLLPNGNVLVVGGDTNSQNLSSAEMYDPASGIWTAAGTTRGAQEVFMAATLLPDGTVLVAGGDANGVPVADVFDLATGLWTAKQPPKNLHFLPSFTPLPNGKILLAGVGASPETYDPSTGQWATTRKMNQDRYDHCAALLPDGHLMVAGGYFTDGITNAELYDVGLGSSNSWRPQITSVASPLNLGGNLAVSGSGFHGTTGGSDGNSQDSPADVPLLQLRSLENGQTTFLLTTNWSTNSFASLPVWNFPPGYALATVFVDGIQSTSSIVNISVPIPVLTTLTSMKTFGNHSFQFTFTNNPGATLGVLATTNLLLPSSNWTALGGVTEIAPGQFQFTDPQAATNPQRYYRLFVP